MIKLVRRLTTLVAMAYCNLPYAIATYVVSGRNSSVIDPTSLIGTPAIFATAAKVAATKNK